MSESQLQAVAALDEVPDGGAADAEIRRGDETLPVMLLREGARVRAYINVCPHQGRMLNFAPNRFMVRDGKVMCSHHGATFRVEDGFCVDGPCRGASLRALETIVQDGIVLVGERNDA